MSPPLFDQDLRLFEAIEDFAIEQLVAEPGIEALAVAVLPGRPRLDVGGPGTNGGNPVPYGLRHELRTVVGPNVGRDTAQDEQITQDVDDAVGVEPALDFDCQAFPAELVEEVQRPEDLAVIRSTVDEVVAPDMVVIFRPEPHTRPIVQPEPSLLRLLHWHFQPLPPP